MAQKKILVDTNTYLRLAQTIHPLLFTPFGSEQCCLYILPELNKELERSSLQNKFYWVAAQEYVTNRQYFPEISKKQKKSIQTTYDYLWQHVQTDLPGPSRVDTLYVAYAIELNIPVVTDDQDMTALAKDFDATVMPTLDLLKLMLDCGHIHLRKISGLFDYLKHQQDLYPPYLKNRFTLPR